MRKLICLFALCTAFGCAQYQGDTPPGTPPTADGGNTGSPNPDYLVAKSGGADVLLINGRYCAASTAKVVGDCAVEGISWTSGKAVTKNANGWFTLALTGNPQECHVSLTECNNTPTTCDAGGSWADYGCSGSPAAPGTHQGGGYMYCGEYLGGPYTCNIAFIRDNGKDPAPRGIVPNGP